MARSVREIVAKALWGKELTAVIEEHNVLVAEVDELRTNITALHAQLDADGGVTDEDYGDLDPAATEAKTIS